MLDFFFLNKKQEKKRKEVVPGLIRWYCDIFFIFRRGSDTVNAPNTPHRRVWAGTHLYSFTKKLRSLLLLNIRVCRFRYISQNRITRTCTRTHWTHTVTLYGADARVWDQDFKEDPRIDGMCKVKDKHTHTYTQLHVLDKRSAWS